MYRKFIFILLIISSLSIYAQNGGEKTFAFLDIATTARERALSSSSLAVWDHDINLTFANPSLLNRKMSRHLALNYTNYIGDINMGAVAYAHHFEKTGTFALGMSYLNYGTFKEALASGDKIGEFTASDKVFNLTYAIPINQFLQFGTNLKFIYSDYYQHYSAAAALDVAINYHNDEKQWYLSLLMKNMGGQFSGYTKENKEPMPFDIQFGLAKKFAHAPFMVMASIHHLNNWNLRYKSPLDNNSIDLEGNQTNTEDNFFKKSGDEFLRHLNIGVELNPLNNVYLRASYNFKRGKELALKEKSGMVGFGLGVGIRISKFHISYAYNSYHVSSVTHTFSITSNLGLFFSKKGKS